MTCINCEVEVSSKFCSNCGQPNPPKKVSFSQLWLDFQSRIYGFDGMFPHTFRDLTLRPGMVVKEFIKGNRVKYYGPVGYFFLMITVFLLLLSLFDVSFYEFIVKSNEMAEIKSNSGMEKFMMMYSEWVSDNMRWFSFLVIPTTALMSKLFFRKSGYNLLEHSLLSFYVQGHIYWLSIFSLIIYVLTGFNKFSLISSVISFGLFGWGCAQLFDYQNKTKAFLKGIAVMFFGFMIFAFVIIVAGIIYVYSHPEYLELIRPSNNR